MLNAQELRIGNIVNRENTGHSFEITADVLSHWDKFKKFLSPMILNEEWLLRIGFVKKQYQSEAKVTQSSKLYFSSKNIITYTKGEIDVLYWYNIRNKSDTFIIKVGYCDTYIDFVHQLQNIVFALKGVELEIVK